MPPRHPRGEMPKEGEQQIKVRICRINPFSALLTDCLRVPLEGVPVVLRLVELVPLVLLGVGQAARMEEREIRLF